MTALEIKLVQQMRVAGNCGALLGIPYFHILNQYLY